MHRLVNNRLKMSACSRRARSQPFTCTGSDGAISRLVLVLLALLALLALAACNLDSPTPIPPTPDLPQVEIIDPVNNATVLEGYDLTLDIVARDSVGVARVELLIDDFLENEFRPTERIEEPVFRVQTNWIAAGVGRHRISVIAYRSNGTRSDEFSIVIEVLPAP